MTLTLRATGGASSRAPACDPAEVRRAAALLFDPEHAVRLQAPNGPNRIVNAADPGALADLVATFDDWDCVYWHLHPVKVGAKKAKVGEHVYRRWLLVDVDRNKDDEATRGYAASDEEREGTRDLALDVLDHLAGKGWPAPVQVDSGNGWHLYWRVDLPNNEPARVLTKAVLASLAGSFAGEDRGNIDEALYSATSGGKLPGTWARNRKKGPGRPHRMCRLMHVPDVIEVVSEQQLRDVAGPLAPPPKAQLNGTHHPAPPAAVPGLVLRAGVSNAWAQAALDRECGRVIMAPAGKREPTLVSAAYKVGQVVAGGSLERFAAFDRLFIAACQAGLDRDTNCNDKGIIDRINRAFDAAKENPRRPPERAPVGSNGTAVPRPQDVPPDLKVIVRASSITPRKVEWLWRGRIPLGKLTTFAGNGGLGKTFVLTDIAARITRGDDWPDGTKGDGSGQVLYISGEDDPEDTLVPRLMAAEADLDKVSFVTSAVRAKFTLADLPVLDRAFEEMGVNVRLVAIDPPTAYLGGINDHKNSELRQLLTPLADWSAARKVAVVFITHVNKPQAAKTEAVMRVLGSVAWTNAVRAAHMFAKDPDDEGRRLFVGMKNNLAKERPGLAYQLVQVDPEEEDGVAKVEWLGPVDITANQAVNNEGRKVSRDVVATRWLVDRFRDQREWQSDDLFRAAKEEGISRAAMYEAKEKLDLPRARCTVRMDGTRIFHWWVPEDWPPLKPAGEESF